MRAAKFNMSYNSFIYPRGLGCVICQNEINSWDSLDVVRYNLNLLEIKGLNIIM